MAAAKAKVTRKKAEAGYPAFQARYFNDLAGFVRDCIIWPTGEHPTPYQEEILSQLGRGQKRISVRGPHGLGKTAMASWIVQWFALTRDGMDWKVITTASAWRQLEKYLWPEIHKWARMLDWAKIGRPIYSGAELYNLKLRLRTGEAFAVASDNPALIEGAHADHILYMFDESKAISPATFDAAEGALTTPGAMAVAISTPGEPNGRFYDIQSRKQGYQDWWVRHVLRSEVIAAGRMTQEWADARKAQWGEESAVYQNRVEGEFAASDEDGVIPLSWIERANERWRQLHESADPKAWGRFVSVGADIARGGDAKTVFALRYAPYNIMELRRYSKQDTMQTAGKLSAVLAAANGGTAIVDVIGLGAGVYDRMRESGQDVQPFNAAASTTMLDRSGQFRFVNVRSAAWWNLREILQYEDVALPPDDILTGDLTAPKWRVTSGGKILIESKDEIAKRLGRSTDDGDAVVMALWEGQQNSTEYGDDPLYNYRG